MPHLGATRLPGSNYVPVRLTESHLYMHASAHKGGQSNAAQAVIAKCGPTAPAGSVPRGMQGSGGECRGACTRQFDPFCIRCVERWSSGRRGLSESTQIMISPHPSRSLTGLCGTCSQVRGRSVEEDGNRQAAAAEVEGRLLLQGCTVRGEELGSHGTLGTCEWTWGCNVSNRHIRSVHGVFSTLWLDPSTRL